MLCVTTNIPKTYTQRLLTHYQEKWTDVTETSNDQSTQLCFVESTLRVSDYSIHYQAYIDLKFIGRCNPYSFSLNICGIPYHTINVTLKLLYVNKPMVKLMRKDKG